MSLFKQMAVAASLTLASIVSTANSHAHDVTVGKLTIGHPWSRPSPMAADVAAGFLTITNSGSEDDRLVKATAEITGNVQIHDMKMEGDMMKMVELTDGIVIPAGQTVELKPGSLHIMFMGLKAQPATGSTFKGTLSFEKAGSADIEYMVHAADAGMN